MRSMLSMRRLGVLVGIVAACLLIWFFGAQLLGAVLAGVGARLLAIAAVISIWLAIEAISFWRRRRNNARMLDSLKRDQAASPDGTNLAEQTEMQEQFDRTFELLRSEKIGGGLAQDFLYALPFYLLIGPQSAGKSSLVARSGLRMPIEDRLGTGGLNMQVSGRRTRWWFAEDGLLITTAGSDDQQSEAQEAGAATWNGLLAFLSKHRPRRPLDAIVVVVDVDTLLTGRGARLAANLRARLQDAMRAFSARLPIYVVVSKCDHLPGFEETFWSLDETQRARAVGTLLPVDRDRAPAADVGTLLLRELSASLNAVSRLVPFVAATERDPARRALIVGLPEQLSAAAAAAVAFTVELVRSGRRDRSPMLRGVFFTASGGPEPADSRLVDGWGSRFSRPMGLSLQPAEGRRQAGSGESDRSYFVTGLFRDCIFPEAGLADRNPKVERRMAMMHAAGYIACLTGLVASCLLWFTESAAHRARLELFLQGAARELALERSLAPSSGMAGQQPLLDEARQVSMLNPSGVAIERFVGFSPLGIIAGTRDAARSAYSRILTSQYLPAVLAQLSGQLRQAVSAGSDAGTIRSLLAVYLMMGEPEHYARQDVSAWGAGVINAAYGLDPERREAALDHFTSLLDLMPVPVSLDQALISNARSLLRQRPDADRIYAQLRNLALNSSDASPIDVVEALGPAGSQLLMLRSQAGLPVSVPGFYTRDGFYKIFVPQAPRLVRNAGETDWVLGHTDGGDAAERAEILARVTDAYVRDYVKAWQSIVGQMALRELPDLPSIVSGLQTLAGPDSPLVQFIQLVTTHTDLPVPAPAPEASILGQVTNAVEGAVPAAGPAAAGAAQTVLASVGSQPAGNPLGTQAWPGDAIRTPFATLQGLIASRDGRAPVLRIQDSLTAAYGVMSGIASAQDPDAAAQQVAAKVISGQGGDPLIGLRVQAVSLPRPVDGIIRSLYQNIWDVLLQLTRSRIQAVWSKSVAPVCEQSISRRFPFADPGDPTTLDVGLRDFADVFAPRGIMDTFVADNLAAFTTPGRDGTLTLTSQGGLTLDLSRDALSQINRARRIRDLFFDTNGNLSVAFTLTPSYLDPRVLSAALTVGPTSLTYRHEPPRQGAFQWPSADGSDGASLTLSMTDGQTPGTQASGPWALFRLLRTAQPAATGGGDRLKLTFQINDTKVSYTLRAGSVANPFSNRDFEGFRCVPRL
ncbi:type VI secretion system membrane subunit TssM [Inquilinus sp. CA228]